MESYIDVDFKNFIINMLTVYGQLKPKYIVKYTTPECMKIFRLAFTHKSFDSEENYEVLELFGDTKVNDVVLQVIRKKHPTVTNVNWITKMKHYLMSKKVLAKISGEIGFIKHIRFGEQFAKVNSKDFESSKEYLNMLEDTFEAFTEAIFQAVIIGGGNLGTAYEVAFNIIFNILIKVDLPLDHRIYFDAKTRLKEIYDEKQWAKDGDLDVVPDPQFGKMIRYHFVGYPLGDQTRSEHNKVVFPIGEGNDKTEAIQKAATLALESLAKYNIKEKIPDPFSRKSRLI